jgi:hypothetical protein
MSVATIDYIDHGWTVGSHFERLMTAGGVLPTVDVFYCDMETP